MLQSAELYARTYDALVPDWPGEQDFYRELARQARPSGGSVLEVACGTGRIAVWLLQDGVRVTGIDLSPAMLAVAREKSRGMSGARWIEADMRSFELAERFSLVLIPGHSFQHLNTAEEQVASLACIRRHLLPGGRLVIHLDHQDFAWLGTLRGEAAGSFEAAGQVDDPVAGGQIRKLRAWSFHPATQTAICHTRWERLDSDGRLADSVDSPPLQLHCLFRVEMEHLLARVGLVVEAVFGDFRRGALVDDSRDMIWVVREGN